MKEELIMNTQETFQYDLQKALFDTVSEYVKTTENISMLDVASQIGIAVSCNLFNALSYSELTDEENRTLYDNCFTCISSVASEIYPKLVENKNKE